MGLAHDFGHKFEFFFFNANLALKCRLMILYIENKSF